MVDSLTVFVVATCGVLGLVIGSFLNVVIWRVPRKESIVAPGSVSYTHLTLPTILRV